MAADIKFKVKDPEEVPYDAEGSNLVEVAAHLNGLMGAEWAEYTAEGTENLDAGELAADGVTIVKAHMSLSPYIIIPKWVGKDKASPEDQKTWKKFMKALRKHEMKHHKIQKAGIKDLLAKLKSTKNLTQPQLVTLMNANGLTTASAQDLYDRTTQHGKLEGAWLDV